MLQFVIQFIKLLISSREHSIRALIKVVADT